MLKVQKNICLFSARLSQDFFILESKRKGTMNETIFHSNVAINMFATLNRNYPISYFSIRNCRACYFFIQKCQTGYFFIPKGQLCHFHSKLSSLQLFDWKQCQATFTLLPFHSQVASLLLFHWFADFLFTVYKNDFFTFLFKLSSLKIQFGLSDTSHGSFKQWKIALR